MARIGITPCRKLPDYEASVTRAGAEAVVLDLHAGDAAHLLDGLDGLIMSGGGDIDPQHYGEPKHDAFSPAEDGRDATELALAREAVARSLPLLAICRGAQVLNVASGGTLEQDIPSSIDGAQEHYVETTPSTIAHDVWVTSGSVLARLLSERIEEDTLAVNPGATVLTAW